MDDKRSVEDEQILIHFGAWLRDLRKNKGFTQEEFAAKAGFSRSYYTEVETGKRNVSLLNLVKIAHALQTNLRDLSAFQDRTPVRWRRLAPDQFIDDKILSSAGLTTDILRKGIEYAYEIIDNIDQTLLSAGVPRISQMIELANLSSMLGNILGTGIEQNSQGTFQRNNPHKYPDLLAQKVNASDIEIKISLETNKPKGHLAKAGYYLTCRYVLTNENGVFTRGKANRGDVISIWEVRFGWLAEQHFNLSSTEGDSGKTAVVNTDGMNNLKIIYCDLDRCPYSTSSKIYKQYQSLYH